MMPFHFQEETGGGFHPCDAVADNPTLLGWDLIWEPAGWVFGGQRTGFRMEERSELPEALGCGLDEVDC